MEVKGIVAASQPRWIPVTERLPDNGVEVLLYSECDGVCVDYLSLDGVFDYHNVTHWMPLPAPPTAGE